ARGAHDVNETQTYYKLGDQGPSLDAAQDVHRSLVRNLGIETQRLLPGNYFVLRNSAPPGILTEASYITDPDVEARLALAAKERLEAEALLIGLGHFFARRVPVVVRVTDGEGFALRDSLALRLTAVRGAGVAPAETLVTAADGVAWGYLRCPRSASGAAPKATVALAARVTGHAAAHAAAHAA